MIGLVYPSAVFRLRGYASKMIGYFVRRLILAFFIVWVISVLSFVIVELPEGDAATRLVLASSELFNEGDLKAMEHELRSYLALDRPRHMRYLTWVGNLLQGDLGRSFGTLISHQKAVKDCKTDDELEAILKKLRNEKNDVRFYRLFSKKNIELKKEDILREL